MKSNHPIEVVEYNKLKERIDSEKGKEKEKEAEFDFGTARAKQQTVTTLLDGCDS
jgi:hypothetical protein